MAFDQAKVDETLRKIRESLKKNAHASNGVRPSSPPPAIEPPSTNGKRMLTAMDVWKVRVASVIEADCEKAGNLTYQHTHPEQLVDSACNWALSVIRETGLMPPEPTDLELEVRNIASGVVQGYLDKHQAGAVVPAYAMSFEVQGTAIVANEEYLKREPVVAGLCYSSAVAMITGGKHAGKSTLARWLAICVAKHIKFLDREVQQGEVLYLASEDETMAARQELLRLGWGPDDPIKFLSMSNVEVDQLQFLESLKDYLRANPVKLVIMDMLFDFAPIRDEMSYAQTREAVGAIQSVASVGSCHIVVVHHAPKYLDPNKIDAAVTALGSQGLAARVSPIIQVRRHGLGLHSVLSTSVRDPRGEAIEEKRLVLNGDGSMELGKAWKDWMQAEVFASKVFDLLEEEGQEMTRGDVQEALAISQQLASACLKKLHNEGKIERAGSGKKGKPFRYSLPATVTPDQNGTQGKDICTIPETPKTENLWGQRGSGT